MTHVCKDKVSWSLAPQIPPVPAALGLPGLQSPTHFTGHCTPALTPGSKSPPETAGPSEVDGPDWLQTPVPPLHRKGICKSFWLLSVLVRGSKMAATKSQWLDISLLLPESSTGW